jgi:hypothetical protein
VGDPDVWELEVSDVAGGALAIQTTIAGSLRFLQTDLHLQDYATVSGRLRGVWQGIRGPWSAWVSSP